MIRQDARRRLCRLKGENPADLPLQAPIKYELGDQSQDRRSLGLKEVPPRFALMNP